LSENIAAVEAGERTAKLRAEAAIAAGAPIHRTRAAARGRASPAAAVKQPTPGPVRRNRGTGRKVPPEDQPTTSGASYTQDVDPPPEAGLSDPGGTSGLDSEEPEPLAAGIEYVDEVSLSNMGSGAGASPDFNPRSPDYSPPQPATR